MKYMIMIWHNPKSRGMWEGFSDAQRAEGWRAYAELNERLVASGEMVISEALADPSQGRRVPAAAGQSLATDGPFAESKEQLAGFYLVDCESFERAMEIAAMVPESGFGLVEVRPVLAMNGPDM